jgi:alkylation response protein AidB-like acyl-CoA dehydrogenase
MDSRPLAGNQTMKMQKATDAQRQAVESFRTFLALEVTPVIRKFRGRSIPAERMREITQGVAEFGLPGASIAPALGGMGFSVITEAMLLEELCVVSCEVAHCVIGNMLVASVLADLPVAQQKLRDQYLPDLLAGRSFAGLYLPQTDAQAEGGVNAWQTADGWVINGAHEQVCNGLYCDFLIAQVRTERGALCHVLVEREQHGYTSRILDRPTLNGMFSARVSFSNVRLPVSQVIWEEQNRLERQTRLLEQVDVCAALLSIGLTRAVQEACIAAAQLPDSPGCSCASQPLAALRIAEMATRLEAARLMCLRAYSLIDDGTPCQLQASMARWLASETALKACQNALQLPGGKELSAALDLERLVRESIVLPSPNGLTDAQKFSIANALMGISIQPTFNVVAP